MCKFNRCRGERGCEGTYLVRRTGVDRVVLKRGLPSQRAARLYCIERGIRLSSVFIERESCEQED